MLTLLHTLIHAVRDLLRSRRALQLEILALRHQLAVYQRHRPRPQIRPGDRVMWALLSRHWDGWREALFVVRPDTVLRWRRRRFREHWTRLSRRGRGGRPAVPHEVRTLIWRMSSANPLWGAPRIGAELRAIGLDIAPSTVDKYRRRPRKPPSPTWKAFLKAHLTEMVAVDFLTVPTIRNRVLFVFLVLSLDRRRVVHFNVTTNPTAAWTARQIVEAFPWDEAPRFLQRDRDKIYGEVFRARVDGMGIEQVVSAPRSPWQNGYVERMVGTIRRECLDHVVVLGEWHLKRVLRRYFDYYHRWRPHQGLLGDSPDGRRVQAIDEGDVVEVEEVFGLHHHYERRAA